MKLESRRPSPHARDGLPVVMMTGDNRRTADAVAAQVGGRSRSSRKCCPGQSGEGQVAPGRGLHRRHGGRWDQRRTGPGVRADVGMAIGTGTDVAIRSSDITLIAATSGPLPTRGSRTRPYGPSAEPVLGVHLQRRGHPVAAGVLFPFTGWLLADHRERAMAFQQCERGAQQSAAGRTPK